MRKTIVHADPIDLSAIDEERFGIRTARAPNVTLANLASVLEFCRRHDVVLLVARCLTTELKAVQAMERDGFELMDTLVYHVRNLPDTPITADNGKVLIRPFRSGEEKHIEATAAECYKDYFGHYHADERLDRAQCTQAYVSWAARSCVSRDVADQVLVAYLEDAFVGFFTVRLNSPDEGEGVISGVSPSARGLGIYRQLMIHAMEWCRSQGAKRMVVSTQIVNVAVQKVWTRLGFEPSHSYYTFHNWFR